MQLEDVVRIQEVGAEEKRDGSSSEGVTIIPGNSVAPTPQELHHPLIPSLHVTCSH